jgi:predicted transposase YdaD
MTPSSEPPRHLPDRIIRESLRHPASLREFLQHAVPDLAAGFDCQRARLIDREFPLEDWRRREADLPFEIPYRTAAGEQPALVCVLIEHQSDTDPLMPLRMLYFAVAYWDRQWKAWAESARPRPPLRLSPVLPIVLYTGPTSWGSNRTMTDLLADPEVFRPFAPSWQPLFWNLAERTPQELLQTGVPWMHMLAVVRAELADVPEFQTVLTEAAQHLAALRGQEEVRRQDLMRIILTYACWRRPAAEREALVAAVMQAIPTRQEEIRHMVQTIAESWIEEGRAKGRAEGRAEGLAAGELNAYRDVLPHLLTLKFGPLPETVLQRIGACADVERLKAALERVATMQSLDELDL